MSFCLPVYKLEYLARLVHVHKKEVSSKYTETSSLQVGHRNVEHNIGD